MNPLARISSIFPAAALLMVSAPPGKASGEQYDGASQQVIYDVMVDGTVVGQRQLVVRYLAGVDAGRLLESLTKLSLAIPGWPLTFQARSTARERLGYTAVVASVSLAQPPRSRKGKVTRQVYNVQARNLADGSWTRTVVEAGRVDAVDLRRTEVALTSLDLFDPLRHRNLQGTAGVLLAETGEVWTGPVTDARDRTIALGGHRVQVSCRTWSPDYGRFTFCWDDVDEAASGLMVRATGSVLGHRIALVARDLPGPRTFGQLLPAPPEVHVDEQDL